MDSEEIKLKIKEGGLRAKVIIEIVGTPENKVLESINNIVGILEKSKIEILDKEIAETEKVGDKFYSSFIETELLFPNLVSLVGFIFDYMPSSVEILEPEKITEKTEKLTDLLNDLALKLHQYNEAIIRLKAMNALSNKKDKKVEKKD